MLEFGFPKSLSLGPLLTSEEWSWEPFGFSDFWIGKDRDGQCWLVKFRGGFRAVRERAFSVIAQALGISCQSSTFLTVPKDCPPFLSSQSAIDSTDCCQLAIWLLDEHDHTKLCDPCPLRELNELWCQNPYDISVLRSSPIENAIDIARGEMLGMLCEMHEPPGWFFTTDHRFVQIDNELMFSSSAGADLHRSPWLQDEGGTKEAGLNEAIRLCEDILSLPEETFEEALRLPAGYRPKMCWNMRKQVSAIRPRARAFLNFIW